jgi:hypothetical protein
MFEIGDKVVCVNALNWKNADLFKSCGYNVTYPVEQGVYTVRDITNIEFYKSGIRLKEISNPIVKFSNANAEPTFASNRFVKLSDLTEMEEALNEAKQILELQLNNQHENS